MGRFLQDFAAEIDFLSGCTIEKLWCVYWKNPDMTQHELQVLWLKVKENDYWLRFFLDAGACFGAKYHVSKFEEEWQEDLEDEEDFVCDYGKQHNLVGKIIISASVQPIGSQGGIKLSFLLEECKRLNFWADCCDGEANIKVGDL